MFAILVLTASSLAQADPIGMKLDKQREEYQAVRTEVISDLVKKAANKENAARKAKRPSQALIASLVADQENLTIRGWLPTWTDQRTKAKLSKARNAMMKAISKARSDYLLNRQDKLASWAARELAWMDTETVITPPIDPRWVWKGEISTFTMKNDHEWSERVFDGTEYHFVESDRNTDFVEMVDSSRNRADGGVVIRIYEHKAHIWFNSNTARNADRIYDGQWTQIKKPHDVSGAYDRRRVWIRDGTKFISVADGWEEVDANGTVFRFQEVGRTWKSVDLLDRSRHAPNGILVKLCDGKAEIWDGNHGGEPAHTYIGGWEP